MEQSRTKSPIFWIGAISAVYEAFVGAGVSAGVELPWWIGAVSYTHLIYKYKVSLIW